MFIRMTEVGRILYLQVETVKNRSHYSNIVDTIADIEEYMVKKRMINQKSEIRYQLDEEIQKLGTRSRKPRVNETDYFLNHQDLHAARQGKII